MAARQAQRPLAGAGDARRRPLQELQRFLRPPGRRPVPARGGRPDRNVRPPHRRPGGALRRRGIRAAGAGRPTPPKRWRWRRRICRELERLALPHGAVAVRRGHRSASAWRRWCRATTTTPACWCAAPTRRCTAPSRPGATGRCCRRRTPPRQNRRTSLRSRRQWGPRMREATLSRRLRDAATDSLSAPSRAGAAACSALASSDGPDRARIHRLEHRRRHRAAGLAVGAVAAALPLPPAPESSSRRRRGRPARPPTPSRRCGNTGRRGRRS